MTEIKPYVKIPNDFFYNEGEILNEIGGRNGFVLYCFLTARKNINNHIYITLKQIGCTLQFDKNTGRLKKTIIKLLKLLINNEYIKCSKFEDLNVNDEMDIEWIEQFPKFGGKGWIKFYADDFELFDVMGVRIYSLMWMLRMYKNYKTQTSFLSVSEMSHILKCDRNEVQDGINIFRETGLFEVKLGEYYYHEELDRNIRQNNEYKYIGNVDEVINYINNEIKQV